MHAIGNHCQTYSETQTTFYECANIVNERPIGTTAKSLEDGSYLCPNDLLLGRSTNSSPSGDFDFTSSNRKKISFIQNLSNSFWKKWISDYFPSLLERKTWHQSKRDMKIDDVVIIQDKDLKRGQWKIGQIREVSEGIDGHVRRVKVRYVNPTGALNEVERPV